MELPHLGKHCGLESCNQLDFLPYKCDYCVLVFCSEHWKPDSHGCSRVDARAVTCPVCDSVVAVSAGEDPNVAVDGHIRAQCRKSRPVFTSSCEMRGCKTKSAIQIKCPFCSRQFCIKHRLEADHQCTGAANATAKGSSRTINSTISSAKNNKCLLQ